MIYISDAHSASSKHTKNSKSASIRSKSDSMNSRKQPSVRKYGLEDGDKLPSGMGRKKSSNPKIRLEDNMDTQVTESTDQETNKDLNVTLEETGV